MTLQGEIQRRHREGRALLAANFYNAETLLGILAAAKAESSPVILQTSPGTIRCLGLETCVGLARGAARDAGVTAWLHLDHATDPEMVRACVHAGYDSVMIDASQKPFEENVQTTSDIVRLATELGVLVEAELGRVPKPGEDRATEDELTDPKLAADFVRQTGVDLLAVAIGTAHGLLSRNVRLDLQRLEAIARSTGCPLVLHGSSGLDAATLRDCIRRGIVKINLASESKDAYLKALQASLCGQEVKDPRELFPPCMRAVENVIRPKLVLCG